jgi:hypothetical protein
MSNIPNNIKKMWEEAAKMKKPEIGKMGGDKKPLHNQPAKTSYGTVKPAAPKSPDMRKM